MSQLLDSTSIKRKPLIALARSLSHDRESFLQILLDFSEKTTFNRIVHCPTYPVRVVTKDLENRTRLFHESIASNPYDISYALAFLYEAAAEIEFRKKNGQYFTPACIASKAITRIFFKPEETLLDPGCGTGIFSLTILKEFAKKSENPASFRCLGIENDPLMALSTAVALDRVNAPRTWQVLYGNYLNVELNDIIKIIGDDRKIDAIICNPPFVRFHHLGERSKLATKLHMPSYSGLHSFFLAHSSRLVNRRGRMQFIVPLEMDKTHYGSTQLKQLKSKFKIENEITCYDDKNNVWNNLVSDKISLEMHTKMKYTWNILQFYSIQEKEPQLLSGCSKIGQITLASFASVHRGISTGANNFFVINDNLAKELGIRDNADYLNKVIPTKITKAKLKLTFEEKDWDELREESKPCWLLTLPEKTPLEEMPSEVRQYIKKGESLGIHLISTCKNREPWYCIKVKRIPDLFFTYISHGFPKFSYNQARVYNLNNLLGIYLKTPLKTPIELYDNRMGRLAKILGKELICWINQESVGRRYEEGLTKFEPTDLKNMPISVEDLKDLGIVFQNIIS